MKFIKKSFLVLSLLLLFGVGVGEVTAEAASKQTQSIYVKSMNDLIKSADDSRTVLDTSYSKKIKKGTVVVKAKVVCDQTYRAKYPDWKNRAKKTVVKATNMLYDKYNIYYNVKKGGSWTSGTTKDPDKLLGQLWDKYNVNKVKEDVVVGFTWKKQGNVLGIGYIGAPYSLVCATVHKTDIQVAQHETGHNYGLKHCKNAKCTMYKYSYQKNTNKLCKTHKDKWKKNRKKY